jgi:hypothetical protein
MSRDEMAESVGYGHSVMQGHHGQVQGHVLRSGASVHRHSGQGQGHEGEHEDGSRGRGAVHGQRGQAQGQVSGSGATVHWHSGQGQGHTSQGMEQDSVERMQGAEEARVVATRIARLGEMVLDGGGHITPVNSGPWRVPDTVAVTLPHRRVGESPALSGAETHPLPLPSYNPGRNGPEHPDPYDRGPDPGVNNDSDYALALSLSQEEGFEGEPAQQGAQGRQDRGQGGAYSPLAPHQHPTEHSGRYLYNVHEHGDEGEPAQQGAQARQDRGQGRVYPPLAPHQHPTEHSGRYRYDVHEHGDDRVPHQPPPAPALRYEGLGDVAMQGAGTQGVQGRGQSGVTHPLAPPQLIFSQLATAVGDSDAHDDARLQGHTRALAANQLAQERARSLAEQAAEAVRLAEEASAEAHRWEVLTRAAALAASEARASYRREHSPPNRDGILTMDWGHTLHRPPAYVLAQDHGLAARTSAQEMAQPPRGTEAPSRRPAQHWSQARQGSPPSPHSPPHQHSPHSQPRVRTLTGALPQATPWTPPAERVHAVWREEVWTRKRASHAGVGDAGAAGRGRSRP